MKNIILILSIGLNLLLAILWFFKSSLNEILTQWWIKREESRKEQKQRLIDLRAKFIRLSSLSFLVLIELAVWKSESNYAAKEKLWNMALKTLEEWKLINDHIIHNEMYLPTNVRGLYMNFSKKMEGFNGEILRERPYKERLLEMSQELEPLFRDVIEVLEQEITKL